MKSGFIAVFIFIFASSAFSSVLMVPDSFPTIQSAVNVAQTGDTILLSAGSYSESVFLTPMGLTIAGPFLFSRDSMDIAGCTWRGTSNGDDTLRCLTAEDQQGPAPTLRVIGIRFSRTYASSINEGGALFIVGQQVSVEHCEFDSCSAGLGGAISLNFCVSEIKNCRFNYCGANIVGGTVRLLQSRLVMDSCIVENSVNIADIEERPELFAVRASNLTVRNSTFRDCGHQNSPAGGHFVYAYKPPDSVEIVGSEFYNNRWINFINRGSNYLDLLRIDSCHFHDELLAGALYSEGLPDCLTTLQVISNVFERFGYELPYVMHGIFSLDVSRVSTVIRHNLVQDFPLGHTAFGSIYNASTGQRDISRNYIVNNTNWSHNGPPNKQVMFFHGVGEGEFKFNIFCGNSGLSIYQVTPFVDGLAEFNYFGHASGPFDSVGNPEGQGDSIWWAVDYTPWATDTNFISAVPEPREPIEVPNSFIGNAYPNPFNGQVTIEFVVRSDQEISLDVYDLTGRHVATVFDGRMRKGVHTRNWNPESQASGIYFARLVGADGARSTTKLMYLK